MKKISLTIIIIVLLALMPVTFIVQAQPVPTISIQGVTEGEKVTVKTSNFPVNRDFVVRIGLFSTKGIGGIVVCTVNSGAGGSKIFTIQIPSELQSEGKIAIRFDSTVGSYYSYNWFNNTTFGTHAGGIPVEGVAATPTITVASVKKDTLAIIRGCGFPSDETIDILMGKSDTKGINGTLVDTITSDEDGNFFSTFDIPVSLKSESQIAVRAESTDSDLAAYTIFANVTGGSGVTSVSTDTGFYTGIPTFSIVSVIEDEEVTIQTNNFPPNRDFKVLMGKMGTRGIGGILVTTINSGTGGAMTKSFDIPASLASDYRISIRLEATSGGFYAYNWFYNNTAAVVSPNGYSGIPTFSITSVEKDNSVTIQTTNFPADYDFKVLMGKMGTRGIGGTLVTTINSGSGGALTKTFNIPDGLAGDYRIAIRLEATSGGYYAYNWFFNSTYP